MLKYTAASLSCGWVLFSFKFRRCKNMQMQQHNGIIILIQESAILWSSHGSSYIIRMGNRNTKRAGGVLGMLSLPPLTYAVKTREYKHRNQRCYTGAWEGRARLPMPPILWSSPSGKRSHLKCFGGCGHLECSAKPALQKWYFLVFFEALSQLNDLKWIIREAGSVITRATFL